MRMRVAIVATALLMACGGGGGGVTSQTIKPTARDQLAADAAVLQAPDLPALFASQASTSSTGTTERDPKECFAPAAGQSPDPASEVVADSEREYAIGFRLDAIIVRGTVEMFRDDAGATAKLASFGQSAVTNCLKALYVEQLTAVGGTVGAVSVTPSKVEGLGEEQAGFVLSFVATLDAVDHPFAVEFDFTRVGRVGLTVSVFSPRGLDHSLAVTAMTAMVNRLQ